MSTKAALTAARQSGAITRPILVRCVATTKQEVNSNPTILEHSKDIPTTGRITRYALFNFSRKNYQNMSDVPNMCSKQEVDNARSRLRISVNLWTMGISSVFLIIAALYYKRNQASGGQSWVERNREQHKSWQDTYNAHSAEK